MRIVFDASTLHQSQRGSITGVVCFDFGERRQFPEADWNDFVVVIAGWWIAAMEQLGRGQAKVELRFMDGPYWITALTPGPDVLLHCVEDRADGGTLYEVTVRREELERELMSFARQLSKACVERNIQSPDLDELRKRLAH